MTFSVVYMYVFLFGCITVRLCRSELASVRLLIAFSADLVNSLYGQLCVKFQLWGLLSSDFDVSLCFPGSEIKEVKDGEVLNYPSVLSCGPLEPQGGWTLAGEDPKYNRKSKLWKTARREWPDVPYPVPSKPTPSPAEEKEQDTASHSQEDLKE